MKNKIQYLSGLIDGFLFVNKLFEYDYLVYKNKIDNNSAYCAGFTKALV